MTAHLTKDPPIDDSKGQRIEEDAPAFIYRFIIPLIVR